MLICVVKVGMILGPSLVYVGCFVAFSGYCSFILVSSLALGSHMHVPMSSRSLMASRGVYGLCGWGEILSSHNDRKHCQCSTSVIPQFEGFLRLHSVQSAPAKLYAS